MRKMLERDRLLILYPSEGSDFHKQLARRLATACEENSQKAALFPSAEVRDMDADRLSGVTLIIVNPWECSYFIGDEERFFSRLSAARKRITVLAEAIEIQWFERQFRLPMQHDALIDVGFVSQEDKLRDFDVPYHFLFYGPTQEEERVLAKANSFRRSIPWVFIGHYRDARIKLAAKLVEKLDPGGFVFLPRGGVVREGQGTIGPLGLSSVLSKTRYYIWNSHHEFTYYESLRFREALLAGAVPCKIDERAAFWEGPGIPGIFSSVQALCDHVHSEGFTSMLDSAKEFYLSRGRLADHLKEALRNV